MSFFRDNNFSCLRLGATKALTGGKEITEKLIPAVARLAQVNYLRIIKRWIDGVINKQTS